MAAKIGKQGGAGGCKSKNLTLPCIGQEKNEAVSFS